METALPLLIFLGLLFAAVMLILVCGYESREQEHAEDPEGARLALESTRSLSDFFARLEAPPEPVLVPAPADRGLAAGLERHLREERRRAADFVAAPSREKLIAAPEPALPLAEALLAGLERFLSQERVLMAAFVAEPSIDHLHRPLAAGVAGI